MVETNFTIIDNQATMIIIFATIIFVWVCRKRRDLLKWLPSYFLVMIGQLLSTFKNSIFTSNKPISNLIYYKNEGNSSKN